MIKNILILAVLISMSACKSTKQVISRGAEAESNVAATKVISGHYANAANFETAYIKAAVRYKDDKMTQNVTAEIRIKKDEKILVSVRWLGITMAKAIITPTEVKYYEKPNSSYFEGDYTTLSKWLGTDLDFNKVQNMLIGQALDNLNQGKFTASIEDKMHKLTSTAATSTQKNYFFEGEKYLIKRQEISQPSQERKLTVNYPGYSEFSGILFPTQLLIVAMQKKDRTNISITYDSVTFGEELSFPYSVPDGYDRVFID